MKKTEVIQPIAIKSPICFSGDRSVLPNTSDDKASIEKGFPQKTQLPLNQGGVAPGRTDFNSLFYLSTDLRFNLQNGCVITFSQEVSDAIGGYPQDAVLSFIDSEGTYKMVKSVIDDNTYNFVSNPNYIDDIHWQEIKMGGGGGNNLFDPVFKDHILSYQEKFGLELLGEYVYKTAVAGTRYGYPDFYNKVLAEYNDPNNTTRTITVGSDTITITTNSNGHEFFDIADKSIIDNLYNDKKVAWFYGVDTANERIFLPRNDYLANDGRVVGNGKTLTLTNGNSEGNIQANRPLQSGYAMSFTDIYNETVGSAVSTGYVDGGRAGVVEDAEKSGLVNNAFGYIYMCVGNVAQEEAQGQYIDFTTTENDTIPLFTAKIFEFDAGQKNPSWLRANGNYVSGEIYQTCYTELVNLLNYNPLHLKVIDYSSLDPNTDYSEYWIVNQTNQTFRTPLKTSERILVSKKEPTNDDTSWYNLYSDGWLEQGDIINNGSAGSRVISLAQSFKNTNYSLFSGAIYSSGGTNTNHQENPCEYIAKTNSSFTKYIYDDWIGTNKGYWWKATGYTNVPVNNINLFFKVANAVENLELINGAGVLSALNNKLDLTENMIPSEKYDDLTWGGNYVKYTAPANGWFFCLFRNSSGSSSFCAILKEEAKEITITSSNWQQNSKYFFGGFASNDQSQSGILPVKKGDIFITIGIGTCYFLRFIYSTNN